MVSDNSTATVKSEGSEDTLEFKTSRQAFTYDTVTSPVLSGQRSKAGVVFQDHDTAPASGVR